MKKTDFILIGVVILVIVIAAISTKGNIQEEEVEYPLVLVGEPGLHQMTYNDYEEKVESGDPFVVVIERAGCSYCVQYMPIIEDVANGYGIPLYYIDTDTLSSEEMEMLNNKNSYLKRNQWGTPTTLFMLGNRVLDTINGYVEEQSVVNFLNNKIKLGEG